MTHGLSGIAAIALGAVVSLAPFQVRAAYAEPAATPAALSLAEPAPTPDWAESGPSALDDAPMPAPRPRDAGPRHVAHESHRGRPVRDNVFARAATGIVGGVADLGAVAAYPVSCFPNYGACRVRVPHRF